ncbi:putative Mitochondrial ribosomal death associated protein 3 [Trypanosoma vivax]|uniref:Small ribosomal subunit protein mS29 n=1 Tax=Trypanosoma vivax (strain Y486) TaxID=1055687 RepID=G0TWE7_TRYVY|nr:mitochondrial 28S ribosomal protein S29-like protein [Trypanosoma vivax]KAH8613501.1 putative Mitochondrial ribosomal death associated protein 3 [Trypanosoma vivax]CCC48285.1 conserved hypothetical protein [Trypanosoma vivax Y486]
MRHRALGKSLAAMYVRPPVTCYTDACEAPVAMWNGAIPLKEIRKIQDGVAVRSVVKTYSHPPEIPPTELTLNNVNTMYCIGNDELIQFFPEGLGGRVIQTMAPGHPRGFLYRRETHLLNLFIAKVQYWESKHSVLSSLTNGRPGFIIDGPTGCGKSALMCQVVHSARSRKLLTLYVPDAKVWTHGEWCWPSTILPGFFDAPDAARLFLKYFALANRPQLMAWALRCTPKDLPVEQNERQPQNLYELCEWGHRAVAPASVDRQSVCIKFLMDELSAEKKIPIVIVVDGWNLFSHETHFRYPHPDFLRSLTSLNDGTTDIDMYPQELPRIPASRLSFVRGLNKMILSGDEPNKFFVTCTTRDFKPFDGISGFADVETDRFVNSLDEYAPYDAEKDSLFHPIQLGNFNEYEYRAFLRFLINSGELAGLGWGPLWHASSDFERKLYKIGFLSDRNPQRVVDHYHQEMVWRYDYQRTRQKQYLLNRRSSHSSQMLKGPI